MFTKTKRQEQKTVSRNKSMPLVKITGETGKVAEYMATHVKSSHIPIFSHYSFNHFFCGFV